MTERPTGNKPSEHRLIAVLGYGVMGGGIAQLCAERGFHVVVLDTDAERIDAGDARLRRSLEARSARGVLAEGEIDEVLGRVSATTSVDDLRDADIVIEAVVEDWEVKRTLLAAVARVASDRSLLLTNTSALSVTRLAAVVPEPSRFAGLHFFNPPTRMRLVEVIRGLQTSDRTIAAVKGFAEALGKEAIEVADRPGFLVNRVLMPYLNDVVQAYDDGLASADEIDLALELGLGYPMGPLAMLDLVGLDVHERATNAVWQATGDASYAAPPLLSRMVEADYLGKKSKRGFRTRSDAR